MISSLNIIGTNGRNFNMAIHFETLLAHHLAELPTKRCARCKEWKERKYFHRDSTKLDGVRGTCKLCISSYELERRAQPHIAVRIRESAYKYNRSEKGKASMLARNKTEKQKEYCRRDTRRRYRLYPEKVAAHSKVKNEIKKGRLIRQSCEHCGRKPEKVNGRQIIHAHHEDYSKPLDIIWLCKEHHAELHRRYR